MSYSYEIVSDFVSMKESRQDVSLQSLLSQQSSIWLLTFDLFDKSTNHSYSVYDVASALSYFYDKCRIWWICHDKDKNDKNELKTAHVHVVVDFGRRYRLSSVLTEFMKAFQRSPYDYLCAKYDVDNNLVGYVVNPWLSFERCYSLDLSLRYLVHLDKDCLRDDTSCYRYNFVDVISNDKDTFEIACSSDTGEMSKASYWVNVCKIYDFDFQEICMHYSTKVIRDNLFIIRELCRNRH